MDAHACPCAAQASAFMFMYIEGSPRVLMLNRLPFSSHLYVCVLIETEFLEVGRVGRRNLQSDTIRQATQ